MNPIPRPPKRSSSSVVSRMLKEREKERRRKQIIQGTALVLAVVATVIFIKEDGPTRITSALANRNAAKPAEETAASEPGRQDPAPSSAPGGPSALDAIAGLERPTLSESGQAEEVEPSSPEEQIAQKEDPSSLPSVPANRPAAVARGEFFELEKELVLTGMDATREMTSKRDQELLAQALSSAGWDQYRKLLERSLLAALDTIPQASGNSRFDALWKSPVLYQAFLRWQTLGRFSEQNIYDISHDDSAREMFQWLLTHNEAMEEVLLVLKPQDHADRVLVFLKDAWKAEQELAAKYFNLALACAVVFDKELYIDNPKNYGKVAIDGLQRYLWYVEKNERGKLAVSIHRSPARDLVWVVCAPVLESELEWAIGKLHMRQSNWGNAYGMVEYLMERAVEGLDPYENYTFEEILKEGGICVDQSYFCANTARAQGIPAMILGGETSMGPHAWVALKTSADEWNTGVGRIGGVSKGMAENPQTGVGISEQEVWLWNDRDHTRYTSFLNVWRHLWLAEFYAGVGQPELEVLTVRLANNVGKSFPESWDGLYRVYAKETEESADPGSEENLSKWKKFVTDLRREFKDNPRIAQLASQAEDEYVFPHGSETDAQRSLARERRRISRSSSEQADLITSSLKRQGDLYVERGGDDALKQISSLYDRALRDYGGSISGFKEMADDYFGFVKDDDKYAAKAVRDIENAFNRVVKTGDKNWFRAGAETEIYKKICGYYREIGNESRAELLEKRYLRLMAAAQRGAL